MVDKTKYGLENGVLSNIILVLKENKKLSKAILFGSRAKGTFHAGSDIDLALFGNELSLDDILKITMETERLHLPYKLDLIIYNRIHEPALKEHIDRVGVILFDRNN